MSAPEIKGSRAPSGRAALAVAAAPRSTAAVTDTARGGLADLLGALSLATDLGAGLPLETSLRTCLVATHLGARLGLDAAALRVVYHAALLRHLGCTAWSHEAAALVGDDHDLVRTFEDVDPTRRVATAGRAITQLARGARPGRRVRAVVGALTHPGARHQLATAQCAQGQALAGDLGLPEEVGVALAQMYERHDGRGVPRALRGDAITPAAQQVHAAQLIVALHRRHGRAAIPGELRRLRGRALAPALCDLACAEAPALWPLLEATAAWELALLAEPAPRVAMPEARLGDVALAFARFVDLKSPHTVGHSPEVARVAVAAARHGGWSDGDVAQLRLAALLHDLGAASVGNDVWDHPGPLGAAALEQVRLHAYHTERILLRSPLTAPLAPIAGAHHERLDGAGYHRGARADGLGRAARLLAAADAFAAMGERRAHRPALDPDARARALRDDASAGRLCRDAVALVLASGGHAAMKSTLPAGLTAREAEVLGLLARGLATKEIAGELGIAPRTVKHHIEHVYDKTGVSTRAAAALFAARHDLVAAGE